MGRPKKKVIQKKKKKVGGDSKEAEYIGTVLSKTNECEKSAQDHQAEEPEHHQTAEPEHHQAAEPDQLEETEHANTNVAEDNDVEGVDEETPAGEIEMSDEHERPPKKNRHRGPTKMKNIAKGPDVKERVDYNITGQPYGKGSVKFSSYVGTLVREHIPVNIDDWRNVSDELKTVLWKSVQARFELDEKYQKKLVLRQMGCLWRSHKSRIVGQILKATNNQQRMNLRPSHIITPVEWRKFVKKKTSSAFKDRSDSYKERRKKQIPHTTSRKGMVRLAEEMKVESGDPSQVTRLKVWVRSCTRKDGTPVNMSVAEKIIKAADLVGNDAPTDTTNPEEDHLSQLLGPDNPGRLRAMGRGM